MDRKHYSALAVATLASAAAVNAQIQYTNIDPDINFLVDNSYSNTQSFDIDGDGTTDLTFQSTGLSYGFGLEAQAVNSEWAFVGKVYTHPFNSCTTLYVRGAGEGFPIGPIAGPATFLKNANVFINTFPCGDITDWAEGQVKYMGLRKSTGGNDYYGWLRIERRPDIGFDELFVFRDYALNLTPGMPIDAGDPGTCLAPEGLTSVVSPGSVTVSWEAVYDAYGYKVEGRRIGTTAAKSKTTATNSLTISTINPGTYVWKVKAGCTVGFSGYSEEDTLTVPVLRVAFDDEVVTIAPNPTGGIARLDLQGFEQAEIVSIYDMLGQLIWAESVSGRSSLDLPVADLAGGTYLVEVRGTAAVRATRLVVDK